MGSEGFELMFNPPADTGTYHVYGRFAPGTQPPLSWRCDLAIVGVDLTVTIPGLDFTTLHALSEGIEGFASKLRFMQTAVDPSQCLHQNVDWYVRADKTETDSLYEICRGCGSARRHKHGNVVAVYNWRACEIGDFKAVDVAGKRWRRDGDGRLKHDGDCHVFSSGICTCGLLHWMAPSIQHQPDFDEQLSKQEATLDEATQVKRYAIRMIQQWDRLFPHDQGSELTKTINELAIALGVERRKSVTDPVYRLIARCEQGHQDTIAVRGRTDRRTLELYAGLMDGTSDMYLNKPGPESQIGKCGICGSPIKVEIEEVKDTELDEEHDDV